MGDTSAALVASFARASTFSANLDSVGLRRGKAPPRENVNLSAVRISKHVVPVEDGPEQGAGGGSVPVH